MVQDPLPQGQAFFCLEVFLGDLSSMIFTSERPPVLALSLLDFEPIVIGPRALGRSAEKSAVVTFPFRRGKSCVFAISPGDLVLALRGGSLSLMVLSKLSAMQAHLYGSGYIDLSPLLPRTQHPLTPLYLPSQWGVTTNRVTAMDLHGRITAIVSISVSLACLGSCLDLPFSSKHIQTCATATTVAGVSGVTSHPNPAFNEADARPPHDDLDKLASNTFQSPSGKGHPQEHDKGKMETSSPVFAPRSQKGKERTGRAKFAHDFNPVSQSLEEVPAAVGGLAALSQAPDIPQEDQSSSRERIANVPQKFPGGTAAPTEGITRDPAVTEQEPTERAVRPASQAEGTSAETDKGTGGASPHLEEIKTAVCHVLPGPPPPESETVPHKDVVIANRGQLANERGHCKVLPGVAFEGKDMPLPKQLIRWSQVEERAIPTSLDDLPGNNSLSVQMPSKEKAEDPEMEGDLNAGDAEDQVPPLYYWAELGDRAASHIQACPALSQGKFGATSSRGSAQGMTRPQMERIPQARGKYPHPSPTTRRGKRRARLSQNKASLSTQKRGTMGSGAQGGARAAAQHQNRKVGWGAKSGGQQGLGLDSRQGWARRREAKVQVQRSAVTRNITPWQAKPGVPPGDGVVRKAAGGKGGLRVEIKHTSSYKPLKEFSQIGLNLTHSADGILADLVNEAVSLEEKKGGRSALGRLLLKIGHPQASSRGQAVVGGLCVTQGVDANVRRSNVFIPHRGQSISVPPPVIGPKAEQVLMNRLRESADRYGEIKLPSEEETLSGKASASNQALEQSEGFEVLQLVPVALMELAKERRMRSSEARGQGMSRAKDATQACCGRVNAGRPGKASWLEVLREVSALWAGRVSSQADTSS